MLWVLVFCWWFKFTQIQFSLIWLCGRFEMTIVIVNVLETGWINSLLMHTQYTWMMPVHCGYQKYLGFCLGYVTALSYGSCRVFDQGTPCVPLISTMHTQPFLIPSKWFGLSYVLLWFCCHFCQHPAVTSTVLWKSYDHLGSMKLA